MRRLEELSMNAWPALRVHFYDGWIMRYSNGYTKRANSIYPLYNSSEDLEGKITYCEEWYQKKDLPTIFKLTSTSFPTELDRILENRGYEKHPEVVSVQTVDLTKVMPEVSQSKATMDVKFSVEWIDGFANASKVEEVVKKETMSKMLHLIEGKKIVVSIKNEKETIAYGFGVLEEDYLGIFDIVVEENHRGMGHGTELIKGILTEGARLGAQTAYLQVVKTNKAARYLYEKLGFKEHYVYWYRVKEKR